MIVEYSREHGLRLLDPDDFKRFKVTLKGFDRPPPPPGKGLEITDSDALVSIDVVRTLPGAPADAAWLAAYHEMVEKAGGAGWIDDERNAIRAHVEVGG